MVKRIAILFPERWKRVPGYESNYEVSDRGRVRSIDRDVPDSRGWTRKLRGKILKPASTSDASHYPNVKLSLDCETKTFAIHTLVAVAFIGPKPEGKEVAHKDGDKSNSQLENIRYATPTENNADKIYHGTVNSGERCGTAKLTNKEVLEIKRLLKIGETCTHIARKFGVCRANVSMIKTGRTWAHL